jgi:3-hydroxyisobutyrate dehydrogenase-like beta-hydroxyacid dehydrogenase
MSGAVGLIGIGLVGSGLAANLLPAGFDVIGYDIDPDRLAAFATAGGTPATSAADVAEHATRVLLSLMTVDIIRDVLFGADGILASPVLPAIIIDTSTCLPNDSTVLTGELGGSGIAYIDAPISGTSSQIRAKQGTFLVAGDFSAIEQCTDIFDAIAGQRFDVGPSGNGSRVKLAINLVLGLNREALAEALGFAENIGLDPAAFLDIAKQTVAYSKVMDVKGPKMISGDFSTEAKLSQHRKDVGLILDLAGQVGLQLPLSETHAKILDLAIAEGDGELDNSVIINTLKKMRPGTI